LLAVNHEVRSLVVLGKNNGSEKIFRILAPDCVGEVSQEIGDLFIRPGIGPLIWRNNDVPISEQVTNAVEAGIQFIDP
jgi:hypothetical protein